MKQLITVQFITLCDCRKFELLEIDLAHPPPILRRMLREPVPPFYETGIIAMDATQDIQVRNFYLEAHQDSSLVYREQRDPNRLPPVRHETTRAKRPPSKLHPLVQLDEELQRIGEG